MPDIPFLPEGGFGASHPNPGDVGNAILAALQFPGRVVRSGIGAAMAPLAGRYPGVPGPEVTEDPEQRLMQTVAAAGRMYGNVMGAASQANPALPYLIAPAA